MSTVRTIRVDHVDSTQVLARHLALDERASLPLVVVAGRQTAGVGRLGRRWVSPAGGLWFTLVAERPASRGAPPAGAGIACGEIIRSALSTLPDELRDPAGTPLPSTPAPSPHPPMIKWPNDLFIDARKAGGVLIETIPKPDGATLMLCGVGVNTNVSRSDLPRDLADAVITLQEWLGRPVPNDRLLEALVERLLPMLDGRADMAAAIHRAGAYLHARDTEAAVNLADGRRVHGVIRGLTSEGALLLDTSTGVQAVHTGEVDARAPSNRPRA